MSKLAKPPAAFTAFQEKYPAIAEAWAKLSEAGGVGPLDEKAQRMIKLGIAIGAMREGAVRSAVRKAAAAGVPAEGFDQVVALAASTIGLPSAVAVHSWIQEQLARSAQ
ncbi:MAG: carboxymuconolactone decarboxylase family protein [Gemmataceae bacterium]|nr:carboxymuconolactone decarboxylase family protein [Gemmataceae bacterium]